MSGIADFVTQAATQLGIGEDKAMAGAGALLGTLKDTIGPDSFGQVTKAIPDAEAALEAAPSEAAEGGGALGGLLSQAAGALGGDAGKALGLAGKLDGLGISTDQIGSFFTMFIDFLKDKLPADLLETIQEKLGGLLGGK